MCFTLSKVFCKLNPNCKGKFARRLQITHNLVESSPIIFFPLKRICIHLYLHLKTCTSLLTN